MLFCWAEACETKLASHIPLHGMDFTSDCFSLNFLKVFGGSDVGNIYIFFLISGELSSARQIMMFSTGSKDCQCEPLGECLSVPKASTGEVLRTLLTTRLSLLTFKLGTVLF